MTLLKRLQARMGGLIRLKTELYWYDGRGWDKNPGRICLILDATAASFSACSRADLAAAAVTTALVPLQRTRTAAVTTATADALLLIDGSPRWIWVAEADVEIL